jgi:hypothetical protein
VFHVVLLGHDFPFYATVGSPGTLEKTWEQVSAAQHEEDMRTAGHDVADIIPRPEEAQHRDGMHEGAPLPRISALFTELALSA